VASRIHPDLDHISISDRANLPAINPDFVLCERAAERLVSLKSDEPALWHQLILSAQSSRDEGHPA
jgi:hypothetical protein